jgi:hypothetical protein
MGLSYDFHFGTLPGIKKISPDESGEKYVDGLVSTGK